MARKNKDVDRDPELIADMTLLMLYLLSGKVRRGRSARWVAPTHLDANALDQLVRDKLIEDNGDGSVTFTEQGLDGAQYVHDVFLETADVVDMLEERLLLLLALQHTDPKELLNELRGKKGQPAIAAKGDTAVTSHAKNASSKTARAPRPAQRIRWTATTRHRINARSESSSRYVDMGIRCAGD